MVKEGGVIVKCLDVAMREVSPDPAMGLIEDTRDVIRGDETSTTIHPWASGVGRGGWLVGYGTYHRGLDCIPPSSYLPESLASWK